MTIKTAAEQQLDYLKKLKAQQKPKAKKAGPRKASPKKKKPAQARHSLPINALTWKRLQEAAKADGNLRHTSGVGNWAIEILLNLPPGLRKPPSSGKEELFEKIREWLRAIGIN